MIRGRERLRVRDLILSFFAYSQKIDTPESFIALFFLSKKLAQSTFLKKISVLPVAKRLNRLTVDKSVRHYDILAKTRSKMTTTITFSRQNDAGSRAITTYYGENLVLLVLLVLES